MPKPTLPRVCPDCAQPKTYIYGHGYVCKPCSQIKQQAGVKAHREKKATEKAAKGTR